MRQRLVVTGLLVAMLGVVVVQTVRYKTYLVTQRRAVNELTRRGVRVGFSQRSWDPKFWKAVSALWGEPLIFDRLATMDAHGLDHVNELADLIEESHEVYALWIHSCPLGDDALKKILRGNPCLRLLNISRTRISDNSIDALMTMSNLESLSLVETRITPEGIARLLKGLKTVNMNISWTADPLVLDVIQATRGRRKVRLVGQSP